MDKLFHEIFEPAFKIHKKDLSILDGNYSFSSLSNLTPRKMKSGKIKVQDIFTENTDEITRFLNESVLSKDISLSSEIKSKLNNEDIVFVFKAIPTDDNYIILINDLSIENTLHKKYNSLLESSIHIHRKTFAAHNILSRVPQSVPAALSSIFRRSISSLLELKKIININSSSQIHFEGLKKSMIELSSIALNLEYLKEDVHHEPIELTFGELFKTFLHSKVDNLQDFYSNRAFVIYDFDPDFTSTIMKLDTKKFSDSITALVSNSIQSIIDSHASKTEVLINGYIKGEVGAEIVYIDIIDYGNPISPNKVSKIFGGFYSSFQRPGVGLGLTNARKNIQENGGDLKYDSAFQEGNKFTIRFPLSDHVVLSKKDPIYHHTYIFSEHEHYNLILHNFLRLNGIPHSISSSAKDFTNKIKDLENNTCLIFEYEPKYNDVLIEMKNQLPRLSLILLIKVEQYEQYLELNEKIRIKDVILHPATYESILKSLVK